jgi:hypothetical protein
LEGVEFPSQFWGPPRNARHAAARRHGHWRRHGHARRTVWAARNYSAYRYPWCANRTNKHRSIIAAFRVSRLFEQLNKLDERFARIEENRAESERETVERISKGAQQLAEAEPKTETKTQPDLA